MAVPKGRGRFPVKRPWASGCLLRLTYCIGGSPTVSLALLGVGLDVRRSALISSQQLETYARLLVRSAPRVAGVDRVLIVPGTHQSPITRLVDISDRSCVCFSKETIGP